MLPKETYLQKEKTRTLKTELQTLIKLFCRDLRVHQNVNILIGTFLLEQFWLETKVPSDSRDVLSKQTWY